MAKPERLTVAPLAPGAEGQGESAYETGYICPAELLTDGGKGVRFLAGRGSKPAEPAFVIRFAGRVHAFLNRCAHVPVELDWQEGEFFDDSGLYLNCAMHGALYDPRTGRCVGGRCNGKGLIPVPVEEKQGAVFLVGDAPGA